MTNNGWKTSRFQILEVQNLYLHFNINRGFVKMFRLKKCKVMGL